jgi:glycosyltransferase involved in cell wall biosynthesis
MEYKKTLKAKIPAVWYCHEPFRFYYDQEYMQNVPFHFYLVFAMSKQLYCKRDKIAVKNFVNLVLTNSKFNLEKIKEVYGINGSVVYTATDPNKFKPNIIVPEEIRTIKEGVEWLLFAPVGRLNFSKNVIRLVLATKELLDRGYRFRLVITGKGYLESKLRELVNKLSISSYVMLETVPEDELPYYYAMADIVVYPAINEPFGLSVIEAMASGTPPVVANIGGPSETVINGVTGIHVNPYEVPSIVNGIMALLDDKNLREEMGRQGRKHVLANFTWERAVDEYEYYLRKITSGCDRNV